MNELLNKIRKECIPFTACGKVADYIPELSKACPDSLGICIATEAENIYCSGDCEKEFTMQSIVKPFILLLALMDKGEGCVRQLVGAEATGKPFDAFNYSDQALKSEHINPMINTGAIALCTLVSGNGSFEKFERLLKLIQKFADNPDITMDESVYISEKTTGSKNRALAYMLKAYKMIDGDVEDILDLYFRACSVKVTAADLARIAFVFANGGKDIKSGKQLVERKYAKYINAVLMTSGMYDGSGEFAINVGVPAKSGVGGGIMAVVPNRMGIGIYSPALDSKGNSLAGTKALEILSRELDLSIF